MNKSTERRLFDYALYFKKGILIGFTCLIISVTLELAGPLIANKVIDDHIVGVEGAWHEVVADHDRYTVAYDDNFYKRETRLDESDMTIGDPVTVMQVGTSYYFIDEPVTLTGSRDAESDGTVTITTAEESLTYEGEELSLSEIYPFFQPE